MHPAFSLLVPFLGLPVLVCGVLQGFLHREEGQISCGRFPGKQSFGQMPKTQKCLKVFQGGGEGRGGQSWKSTVLKILRKYCATGSD